MTTCRRSRAGQQGQGWPAALRAPVGQRVSCRRATRVCSCARDGPGAVPVRPAGHVRAACAARMLDALAAPRRAAAERTGDPRSNSAHRPVRDGVPHADLVPEVTDLSGEPDDDLRALRTRGRAQPRHVRRQLPAGAAPLAERGVRFVQLFHKGWDQHGNLPGGHPRPVHRDRPGLRRPGRRPRAPRAARGHAGRLGRRVRTHELLAGQADRQATTAATTTRAASRSGWPARA